MLARNQITIAKENSPPGPKAGQGELLPEAHRDPHPSRPGLGVVVETGAEGGTVGQERLLAEEPVGGSPEPVLEISAELVVSQPVADHPQEAAAGLEPEGGDIYCEVEYPRRSPGIVNLE